MRIKERPYYFIAVILFIVSNTCFAQTVQTSWKFDFGIGKPEPGYIKVTPSSVFTYEKGYGFDHGSQVTAIERFSGKAAKNILTHDYITSEKPFFFSVKLPDGNYDIKLVLGDPEGGSVTTVRAENRRFMLPQVETGNGKILTKTITVHIRDSLIRDANGTITGKVRLKPREVSYAHWDNLLTLEFTDSFPKVCALEIAPNTKAVTIFLAGNSTVVDQDREPWAAWGQMIPSFFEPSVISIANYAESGETLKAFKGEKRLDKLWSMIHAGDYLFIEFAHNDQKPGSSHLDPFTTYKETIKEWIAEARKRSVIPVLVTSMHRRNFDSAGHVINTLGDYPEAMRQTAHEENVALIDLNAMSKTLYEAWGPEKSLKAFVHYPANTFPGQTNELKDDTHFNTYGAYEIARCIVKGIKDAKLGIANWLLNDKINFDPSHPDDLNKWYWPLSPLVSSTKPDGN